MLIDCKIDNLYYGKFLAVRDSHIPIEKGISRPLLVLRAVARVPPYGVSIA